MRRGDTLAETMALIFGLELIAVGTTVLLVTAVCGVLSVFGVI